LIKVACLLLPNQFANNLLQPEAAAASKQHKKTFMKSFFIVVVSANIFTFILLALGKREKVFTLERSYSLYPHFLFHKTTIEML